MTVFSIFHETRTVFMKQILGHGRIVSQAAQNLRLPTCCNLNTHDMHEGGTAACTPCVYVAIFLSGQTSLLEVILHNLEQLKHEADNSPFYVEQK
jgi:hypothetical protein